MTWLPDHRATHGPEAQCDGCRPPDVSAHAAASPAAEARSLGSLRPDLVIRPGTNRK